jgi:hypothetical protein
MPQPKFAAPVETLLASMTLEVVLWRFLVREKIIDRDRLLSLPERTSGGLAGDRQRGGDGANFDADGRHSRRGRTHGAANTSLGAGWREHHAR